MKVILIVFLSFIVGCQSTKEAQNIKSKLAVESQFNSKYENKIKNKLIKKNKKNYRTSKTLSLWIALFRQKIARLVIIKSLMAGHKVTLGVKLNDTGYIKNIEIISSSGNEELNQSVMSSLEKGQPYILDGLSDADKKDAQNFVLNFIS